MIRSIEFGKYECRFMVYPEIGKLIIPKAYNTNTLRWVVSSLSHEELHIILADIGEVIASYDLDNLGYNIRTGCILTKRKDLAICLGEKNKGC